jgi:hypothetical protein
MEDIINKKALNSRERLIKLSLSFDHIFAKINPKSTKSPQESDVFVITRSSLPPIPSSYSDVFGYRNYPEYLDLHLMSRNKSSHPHSVINMCELIKYGLIYSGEDPISKKTTDWYKVQSNDILSSYVAPRDESIHGPKENAMNDDVARGYIILLTDDDMERYNFNIVENIDSCPSKGGKSSMLQRKKRKNITKNRRRISRRKPRMSRRNTKTQYCHQSIF